MRGTDDVGSPCLTSTNCYVQVKGDAGRPHSMLADHFVQAEGDTGRTCLTSINHAKGDRGRQHLVPVNRCVQAKDDVCCPRLRMTLFFIIHDPSKNSKPTSVEQFVETSTNAGVP